MDRAKFFNIVRPMYGAKLEQTEVEGTEAVLDAMEGTPIAYCAYALATAFHETNKTMQPVKEAYWLSEDWRKKNLRYWPWYGRGYVQLTWEENYAKADKELKLNGELLANADLALLPDLAAKIMRRGMEEAWFTKYNLSSFLPSIGPATQTQFESSRKIINGTDKAVLVASYAMQFQKGLVAGGWA